MKNYFLLFITLFLLTTAGFAQETVTNVNRSSQILFTEDFEGTTFPPQGWAKFKFGGDETWERTTEYFHEGEAAAGHTAFTQGWLEGWLVTPKIQIPNTGNYLLEFWSYNNWVQHHYYSGVWISITGNDPSTSTFVELKQLEGEDEVSNIWKAIPILLNDYAGKEVYIGFKYEGDWADCWYIDDVSVKEFLDLKDAELLSIKTPAAGPNINLTNNEPVTVVIKNNGSAPITGFEVVLKLDGIVKATQTFSGTIPMLGQADFTFTTTLDLSAEKTYQISATVNLQGDEVPENDSKTIAVLNFICSTVTAFPFIESFENEVFPPPCWSVYQMGSSKKWERTINEKRTGEASATCGIADGLESWLVSPPLKITNSTGFMLEFWSYHLWSELNFYNGVLISTTGSDPLTSYYTQIKKLSDNELEDKVWKKITIPLADYAGETVYIAFKYEGDIADFWFIDDVLVYDFNGYVDGEVTSIITPITGEGLTESENVKVLIRNNSNETISDFNLKLELDGAEVATEPYTSPIPSLGQAEYTFNAKLDLTALGTHEVKVTIVVAGDQLPDNDFKTKEVANFSTQALELFGYRIYDNDHSSPPYGFISFQSNNPTEVVRVNDYMPAYPANVLHAGEYVNGYFYGYTLIDADPVNFVKISTETWTEVSATPVTANPIDMAYDYTTNKMYGTEMTPDGSNLVTINMETGVMTQIGAMGRDAFAFACNTAGKLFIVDRNGFFCSVNKTTGASTIIGRTGVLPYYIQSMSFDHNTGRLFWAMCNTKDEGRLVEIDPASGVCFERGTIGNEAEVIGLYTIKDDVGTTSYQPAQNEVSIYPNPTTGLFTVSVKESAHVTIIDISGKVIDNFKMKEKMTVDLKQPSGVYFIRVETVNGTSTHRLIINK